VSETDVTANDLGLMVEGLQGIGEELRVKLA